MPAKSLVLPVEIFVDTSQLIVALICFMYGLVGRSRPAVGGENSSPSLCCNEEMFSAGQKTKDYIHKASLQEAL